MVHILAVDDERLALEVLAGELEKVFPEAAIHAESNAAAAMQIVQELKEAGEPPAFVFLDIELGHADGVDMARRIRELCPRAAIFFCTAHTRYAMDAFQLMAKGYLLKPIRAKAIEQVLDEMVSDWRERLKEENREVRIQTFGNFEVFVDGNPLRFEREKSKELLAYLVDRRGASVTTEQIAVTLWEDDKYDRKLKNRATVIVSSLKRTLRGVGAEDILVKSWNHLALDTQKVRCDAYDFENGAEDARNAYHGEYMLNYSWAEERNGEFARMQEKYED